MRKRWFGTVMLHPVIGFAIIGLLACERIQTARSSQATLKVAAAADLQFAMASLVDEFRKTHPEIGVDTSYGSSGNFHAQIRNKAPFDLYFSADVKYPNELAAAGAALDDEVFTYAIGRIVVWAPRGSPVEAGPPGIDTLLDPSVKKVAIANPAHAPYGEAAVAAMKSLGVYDQVEPKLVFGENIAQTAQFIQSGAADIGIIALSLALSPRMAEVGSYQEIPATAYPEMVQGGMIVGGTPHPEAAAAFRNFVLGPEGRAALERFGFHLPQTER